ncbi:hypothetical protein QBC35DRAFT_497666 [Podospora australis]|uniref:Zn(2)-C6 fungal-type domain-containing protein n=1 Tax=Podospora australis TaxID=1536484 RepID=A0AAN6WWS8_9PEZI|nr:hypothetical protein QBC35DRAFT_497666 [Podospora australis]
MSHHHHRRFCSDEDDDDPSPNRDLTTATNSDPTTARPSLEQSIHCFRATTFRRQPPHQNQQRSRARLTEAERTKVLGVRRQGACLRCRMLKIECSLENPCQACLQSAVRGTERKVLSFSYCVRTRFADVNIFLSPSASSDDSFKMRTETLMLKMSRLLSRIATPAQFSFLPNQAAFNKTMTSWLTDPNFHLPGGGSIVGLCCSNLLALRFAAEEKDSDLRELGADFQQFLLATSLSHTGSGSGQEAGLNPFEVGFAGQVSGSRLLLKLDRILTPQYLSKLSRSSCQVLFLFVLGAVLGVLYSTSSTAMQMQGMHSPDFPADLVDEQLQQSPTLWLAMREHLCQMLAHHLIYLGGMLGIKLETGMERRIIECAGKGWGRISNPTTTMTPAIPTVFPGQKQQHYDWDTGYVWGDGITARQDKAQEQEKEVLEEGLPMGLAGAKEDNLNPNYWEEDLNTENDIAMPAMAAATADTDIPTPQAIPRPSEPPPPPLVPIACGPELAHFQNFHESTYDWDPNPTSYLNMSEEPENYYAPAATSPAVAEEKRNFASVSRARTEPYLRSHQGGYSIPKERKRRTMWIVRTIDAGPEHGGHINVHARLRAGRDLEGLRSFV